MSLRRQSGLSLVELMIAMAIGLGLLAVIVDVVTDTNRTYDELGRIGRQVESGRSGALALAEDIRHAGFYGRQYRLGTLPAALPDPCALGAAALQAAMPLPLQGYEAPASSPLSCLPAANHLTGTDILVIRRVSTDTTALAALQPTAIYLQSDGGSMVVDSGANAANFVLTEADGTTPAPLRRFVVHIYHVSPCNRPSQGSTCDTGADGGDPVPTLKRLEIDAGTVGTTFVSRAVATGIQNLQLEYGIDSDNDGAPNGGYVTTPASVLDWSNAVGVRLHLLARTLDRSLGHNDAKVYTLGLAGTFGPFADAYRRRVFSTTARVVNTSARRE